LWNTRIPICVLPIMSKTKFHTHTKLQAK
jgi:hypothetical protein